MTLGRRVRLTCIAFATLSVVHGAARSAPVFHPASVGPDQIDARVNLGKTLYEMGRLKESAQNLEEVLKRDPNNEKAQVLLKKMVE